MVRSLSRFVWIPAVLAFVPLHDGFAQDWFNTPRHFPDTNKGQIRTVADMDQDGDADLIWMSETSIQVAFNDGSGEFSDGPVFTPSVPLYLPDSLIDYPKYVQAGDVDGDGAIDVVLGSDQPWSDAKLFVYLNRGGGTFLEKIVALPGPADPFAGSMFATVLGNIDADPELEIATAHDMSVGPFVVDLRSQITWWNWNGSTFVANPALMVGGSLGRVLSLAVVDAGNDGIADLVAAGYDGSGQSQGSSLRILPTVAGAPTLGANFDLGYYPPALASGDLDGDGDLDVIGAHRYGCQDVDFVVLENQGGAFLRKVTPSMQIGADTCAELARVVLGDFDGDGDLDAAQVYMFARGYLNDGTNHFAAGGGVTKVEVDEAFASTGVGAADIDGDGFDDLVCSRAVVFTHGQPFAGAPAPTTVGSPGFATPFFTAFDAENDGDVDLCDVNGTVATNDGSGKFAPSNQIVTPPGFVLIGNAAAVGDFTGNGLVDVIMRRVDGPYFSAVFTGMVLLVDDAGGKYIQSGLVIPAPASLDRHLDYRIRSGVDADNDGDLDVFSTNGYWRNDGPTVAWTFVPTYAAADTTDAFDFDNDGDVDTLVVVNPNGAASIRLMRNNGGSFAPQLLTSANNPGNTYRGLFLDADDDGDRDVAIAAPWGSTSLHLLENVGGSLASPIDLPSVVGATGFFGVADADGDGLSDVILERNPTNFSGRVDVEVHRRVGPGLVFDPARYWIGSDANALVDIDEDGDPDLVGDVVVKARAFQGADDGTILQYGVGSPGAGPCVPVLGASGPLRPGSTTASFRVRRGLGGAPALLFVGVSGAANYANVLQNGPFLVQIPVTLISFNLAGPPGLFRHGTLDIDTSPVLPSIAGLGIWHQVLVLDPTVPGGVSSTNGLELHYGM